MATAHKLARLIYALLTKGEAYVAQAMEDYERQYAERRLVGVSRQAAALGYRLEPLRRAECRDRPSRGVRVGVAMGRMPQPTPSPSMAAVRRGGGGCAAVPALTWTHSRPITVLAERQFLERGGAVPPAGPTRVTFAMMTGLRVTSKPELGP